MRVAKQTSGTRPEHDVLQTRSVGEVTRARETLLTHSAFPACDLERRDDALAFRQSSNLGADLVDDSAELVSENVASLHLNDGAVEEMEVRAADGAPGDLENNVARLYDFGFVCLAWGSYMSIVEQTTDL